MSTGTSNVTSNDTGPGTAVAPTARELPGRVRVGLRDLLGEAVAGVVQRPSRSVLTSAGAAIGVCAVVAVLGLTSTASARVNARFDALRATQLAATAAPAGDDSSSAPTGAGASGAALPADAAERVAALPGVVGAGVVGTLDLGTHATVTSVPLVGADTGDRPALRTVGSSAWSVLRPHVAFGRVYDSGHERRSDRVAVLGSGAARRLGIARLDADPAVFVDGVALTVVGVVDQVRREPDLLDAVIVPPTTARTVWHVGNDPSATLLVDTRLGAASVVAGRIPWVLDPAHPSRWLVDAPPDPRALGTSVGQDLDVLALALAVVSVVLAALGISNTMLVTVMERVHEIGLRRALGAGGGQIAVQFLAESALLGGLGGLAGCAAGVLLVVVAAAVHSWTPILAPTVVLAAPLLGLVAGLVAGVFPALRAARIQPADALRR